MLSIARFVGYVLKDELLEWSVKYMYSTCTPVHVDALRAISY